MLYLYVCMKNDIEVSFTLLCFYSVVVMAYKKTIREDELWVLNDNDRSETLVPAFDKRWQEQVAKCQQRK